MSIATVQLSKRRVVSHFTYTMLLWCWVKTQFIIWSLSKWSYSIVTGNISAFVLTKRMSLSLALKVKSLALTLAAKAHSLASNIKSLPWPWPWRPVPWSWPCPQVLVHTTVTVVAWTAQVVCILYQKWCKLQACTSHIIESDIRRIKQQQFRWPGVAWKVIAPIASPSFSWICVQHDGQHVLQIFPDRLLSFLSKSQRSNSKLHDSCVMSFTHIMNFTPIRYK